MRLLDKYLRETSRLGPVHWGVPRAKKSEEREWQAGKMIAMKEKSRAAHSRGLARDFFHFVFFSLFLI